MKRLTAIVALTLAPFAAAAGVTYFHFGAAYYRPFYSAAA
jgi:hypothetical protein